MKKFASLLLFSLLALGSASFAQGQGSIVGTVTDPSGAVLAGAKITLIEIGTGISRTTTADSQGYYVVPSVKPTQYSISIESSGFRTEKQVVTVLADQALTVNAHLQLGASTEIVEVTGSDLQVDTTTSTVKQVIEEKRISELPLNGRNAATLALLVPGVVNSPNGGSDQGSQKTFPGGVTYSANGTRQDTISYNLDGGNYVDEYTNVNQPFPFPDALQEFSVQTSNYSAEYGQNAGAVVNVITKSGTNTFHGDAFEFVRNPVFNAQNFFATPTTPDRVKRNQYGGTFGGPIVRDKMYFFAGYQRTAFRNLILNSSKVVGQTDIMNFLAKGPFGTPGTIDPAVAKMIGVIPGCNVAGCGAFNTSAGQPDPNAKFSLAGTIPAGSNTSVPFSQPDIEDYDSGIGKLDYTLMEKDKLSLRYEFDKFTRVGVFNPKFLVEYADATSPIQAQSALIHETHAFSPTFLNDARISYSREISRRGPDPSAVDATAFGATVPFEPKPSALQGIGVQGGFNTLGTNPTGLFIRQNFGFANDLSWVHGKHDIRFGGSIERSHVDLVNQFNQPGLFGFGTSDNYLFGSTVFPTYSLFLAGILSDGSGAGNGFAFQQGAGEFKQNRNIFAGVYVQDNFHAGRKLTLNLGLRYEPVLPWSDKGNRWAQVNLAAMAAGATSKVYPNAPPGVFFSGQNGIPSDPGMPDNALRASLKNFEPRIGFAYDVFGDGKTSVRGGFGIFYDSRVMGMLSNRFVDEWPFSPQFILSTAGSSVPTASSAPGSFSDPLCTLASTQMALKCNGQQAVSYPQFPSPFPAPTNFAYIPPFNEIAVSYDPTGNYRVPVVYAFNLSLERQLPLNSVGRVAYVGSLSRHILETQYLNYASPSGTAFPGCGSKVSAPGSPGTGIANCTVFAGSGGKFKTNTFSSTVQADVNDINSSYHSLQLSLEKRASHGVTFLVNYTFSKSLDDLPFSEGVSGFDTGYSSRPINDPLRHAFDYGPSSFDHRHVFVASYVWQTPSFKSSGALMHHLFGDYELSGIVSASSGRPFTVLQGFDLSGTGIGNDHGTLCTGTGPAGDPCVVTNPYSNATCAGKAGCVSWFNPNAFEPSKVSGNSNSAIASTYGTAGKNAFRLPGASNWDVQLSKYITVTERLKLQLRIEYFNVLNHPNFAPESVSSGAVNGTDNISNFDKLSSGSFGTFTASQGGVSDPRIAQLAAKIIF